MTDMQYASIIKSFRRKMANVLLECVQVVIAPYILVKYSGFVTALFGSCIKVI
jgi:hypothetical protein